MLITLYFVPSYLCDLKKYIKGLPWWSNGKDSMLPLQRVQVRNLVRQLRFWIICRAAKKKKTAVSIL